MVAIFKQTRIPDLYLFIHQIPIYCELGTLEGAGDIAVKIQAKVPFLMVLLFQPGGRVVVGGSETDNKQYKQIKLHSILEGDDCY